MSETPCKYFLHSESSLNSLYSRFTLLIYIPECKLLLTKFLNTLFVLDTASLEPSEVEVRSISLIISKTHFFHRFIFLPGILFLFHSFSETFLQKLSLYLFSIISKTKLLFSCFFLNLKAQYLNHPIQLHYKSLRSNTE